MSVAVILGSAFDRAALKGCPLEPAPVSTPFGEVILHKVPGRKDGAYVLFRHGVPHRYLPNQIPFRAHAAALEAVRCRALLVTSSVGVLDPGLPLYEPLPVGDLLMPENRLPDGSACTMFPEPREGQGHLVVEEGLFSRELGDEVREIGRGLGRPLGEPVVFAYAGGPRTKTPAENDYWRRMGAKVNSISLGPEVVLANELEIPTAGLVVGHKYSVPGGPGGDTPNDPLDDEHIAASLRHSHESIEGLVAAFLEQARPVPFRNRLYRWSLIIERVSG